MNRNGNTYSEVLINTYRLMFNSNIESITIAELEKKLMRSRGSVFYYFKGKRELLKAVIDVLFFPIVDQFDIHDINSYKSPFERLVDSIIIYDKTINPSKALFNIISQADKFYPNFTILLKDKFAREKQMLLPFQSELKMNIDMLWAQNLGKLFFDAYELTI